MFRRSSKQLLHLRFELPQIYFSLVTRNYMSLGIDQVAQRKTEHATEVSGELRIADHDGIADRIRCEELLHLTRIIIHRHADHLQASPSELTLPPRKLRHLLAARRAPRGPEVEQD